MARYRRLFLLPLDVFFLALSHTLAYLIRFDWRIPPEQQKTFLLGLTVAVCLKPVVFVLFGFYKRLWRYASIADLVHILKAVFTASASAAAATLFFTKLGDFPRSIPILDFLLLTAFIMGRSLAWRLVQERNYHRREELGLPTLVVGAGMAGRMLLQEVKNNSLLDYSIAGFLDDDPAKIGAKVNNVPVLGPIQDLKKLAKRSQAKKVVIAIPSAPSKLIREVVQLCRDAQIEVQTLPPITDMLDGKLLAAQLRNVKLEDLLGRDPVKLDTKKIKAYLSGRRVLVTGAGGSIGSEICRQISCFQPSEIILFEAAETPLHDIQLELERKFTSGKITPMLADVRDREQVFRVFDETRPEVVFHAAAYKHVPMMERHPAEAVKTNVFGSRNLAEAADAAGVERFVMISTDKAVNPTNVMGASKRTAEIFIQAFNKLSRSEFITVRFGNVLGSNGSVVPLFQEQIRRGGPLTVTHPEVTRYFMTIPEASQLVLQAGSMGMGGEIFLLDMGQPVKIVDLAEDIIKLSGLTPYEDVDIKFTGLRPGEKLYEELLIDGEGIKTTDHKKILIASAKIVDMTEIEASFQQMKFLAKKAEPEAIISKLREIVPEYAPQRPASLTKQQKKLPPRFEWVHERKIKHKDVGKLSALQPTAQSPGISAI